MKKPSMISILLFLTGLLCIIALIFFNRTTLHQILTTEKESIQSPTRSLQNTTKSNRQ